MRITVDRHIRNLITGSLAVLLCVILAAPAFAQRESLRSLRTDVEQNTDAICIVAAAAGVCNDIPLCTVPPRSCERIVFATSTGQNGNLGGLTGADAICQSLADSAGLPGTYLAWLSDAVDSPSTRFARSVFPYTRVGGLVVADSYTDLTTRRLPLDAGININEKGEFITGAAVWTNTRPDGTPIALLQRLNCNGWTSADDGITAFVGASGDIDVEWTFRIGVTNRTCDTPSALYCFQQ